MFASVDLMLQHLKSNSKNDWFCQINTEECVISGWSILMPQRYGLLALMLLLLGLLYQLSLCTIAACGLIMHATQRFSIHINTQHGIKLTRYCLAVFPYQVKYIPLSAKLWVENNVTPQYLDQKDSSLTHKAASVDVFIQHSEILKATKHLIHCDYQRAMALKTLFELQAHRISVRRLSDNDGQRIQYLAEEPGEWVICLIEILPQLFAPKRSSSLHTCVLSWWAPRWHLFLSSLIICSIVYFLSPYLPGITFGISSFLVSMIICQRESLHMTHQQIEWRRSVLGICISRKVWYNLSDLKVQLQADLYAPRGRMIILYHAQDYNTHMIGHNWDTDWIYHELQRALSHYCKVDL